MLILSPSGLAEMQRCTRAGWYRYMVVEREHEPPVAGSASLSGQYAHKAFEHLHEHPDASTLALKTHLLALDWPSPEFVPRAVAQARAAKIELERCFPGYELLGCEVELTAPIGGDVALGGRMDLVIRHGGQVVIVDLKTSTKALKVLSGLAYQPQTLHYAAGWWTLNDELPRAGLLRADRNANTHWVECETSVPAVTQYIDSVRHRAEILRGPAGKTRTARECWDYGRPCPYQAQCMASLHNETPHATGA